MKAAEISERGPSRGRSAGPIAAADRLAHAHRRRRTDSQRDHEIGCDHLHRDAVRRERRFVQPCRPDRHQPKHRAFEENLQRRRKSEANQLRDAREIRQP